MKKLLLLMLISGVLVQYVKADLYDWKRQMRQKSSRELRDTYLPNARVFLEQASRQMTLESGRIDWARVDELRAMDVPYSLPDSYYQARGQVMLARQMVEFLERLIPGIREQEGYDAEHQARMDAIRTRNREYGAAFLRGERSCP